MEDSIPFTPINFFQISLDCRKINSTSQAPFALNQKNISRHLLPETGSMTGEICFGDVAIGWSFEGIELYVMVKQPYLKSCYPNYDKGDSFELCIDTRDVKTSGYNTRFCHHFVFLPEAVEGLQGVELTKFRTEDAHELCNPKDLQVKATFKSDYYILQCFIPAHCLSGYDPEQFERLGMTYRINRSSGRPQHFAVVAEDYKFQEQPSLWASLRLTA